MDSHSYQQSGLGSLVRAMVVSEYQESLGRGISAWIGMILFIAWLVRTKWLPVRDQIENGQVEPRQE